MKLFRNKFYLDTINDVKISISVLIAAWINNNQRQTKEEVLERLLIIQKK